jgi:hypothetical protein
MKLTLTKFLLIFFAGFIVAIPSTYGAILVRRAIINQGPLVPRALQGFDDTDERVQINCADLIDERTAVMLTFGQSNASNDGETRYRPEGSVFNFNFLDGNCYEAEDPLLGATGTNGSVWSRLGDLLVSRNEYENVIFAPIAYGGSSIISWANPLELQSRINFAIDGLREQGLNVTHLLWHQGSADESMTKEIYELYFHEIEIAIRDLDVEAPIYIAVASCNEGSEVTEAQRMLVDAKRNVLAGPDTDLISDPGDRWQGNCHFSGIGLDKHAEAWFTSLSENPD